MFCCFVCFAFWIPPNPKGFPPCGRWYDSFDDCNIKNFDTFDDCIYKYQSFILFMIWLYDINDNIRFHLKKILNKSSTYLKVWHFERVLYIVSNFLYFLFSLSNDINLMNITLMISWNEKNKSSWTNAMSEW